MWERMQVSLIGAWIRLKEEERGAQTLEWLALALLILAILGGAATLTNGTSFGEALRAKFVEMVGKIQ